MAAQSGMLIACNRHAPRGLGVQAAQAARDARFQSRTPLRGIRQPMQTMEGAICTSPRANELMSCLQVIGRGNMSSPRIDPHWSSPSCPMGQAGPD